MPETAAVLPYPGLLLWKRQGHPATAHEPPAGIPERPAGIPARPGTIAACGFAFVCALALSQDASALFQGALELLRGTLKVFQCAFSFFKNVPEPPENALEVYNPLAEALQNAMGHLRLTQILRRGIRREWHPPSKRIKMSKADFLPTSDADFVAWHDNFRAVAQSSQAGANLSDADKALIESDNAELHAKIAAANLAAAAHKQATAEKNDTHDRAAGNARAIARRIKAQTDYQPALGSLFGIEGPDVTVDLTHAKPHLSCVDKTAGAVEIGFNKLKSDGICLYCQREGDADWIALGHPTLSPFIDNRPLLQANKPELRRYAAVFMLKNQEVGQYSDEAVVNCAP